MLKSIEKLLESRSNLKVGNHSSEHTTSACSYMYHGAIICEADFEREEFKLPYNGAYSLSISTRRAVNDYKRYFTDKGFAFIEE